MRTSRFTDEQIIGIVREYEAGSKLSELCRRHNISPTTFYKWRAKYGGMAVSDAKRLKALEEENRRLKQLLADTMLELASTVVVEIRPSPVVGNVLPLAARSEVAIGLIG